jgi:hypothetical protein
MVMAYSTYTRIYYITYNTYLSSFTEHRKNLSGTESGEVVITFDGRH